MYVEDVFLETESKYLLPANLYSKQCPQMHFLKKNIQNKLNDTTHCYKSQRRKLKVQAAWDWLCNMVLKRENSGNETKKYTGLGHISSKWTNILYIYYIYCCSVAKSCLTLCDPMDCSPPGFSVHGFPRQEHWSGSPFLSPGDIPNPGVNLQKYQKLTVEKLEDLKEDYHHSGIWSSYPSLSKKLGQQASVYFPHTWMYQPPDEPGWGSKEPIQEKSLKGYWSIWPVSSVG